MDRSLLKYILNGHSKVQNKFLFLETGVLGIKEIITSRRCLYFYTILQMDNEELTRKIYNAQRNNPLKGDWICHTLRSGGRRQSKKANFS